MWACPPLAVVQTTVMSFMEMRVRGTIVVPEWEAQAWYVFLRERATHSMPLPWSRARPTMVDTASGGGDSHGVNKWRFRAFFVDNRGGRLDRLFDHESPPAVTVGSKLSRRRLALQDQAEEKLGCAESGPSESSRCWTCAAGWAQSLGPWPDWAFRLGYLR